MNVSIVGSNPSLVSGTFGASGTLSEEFDLTGYTLAGLLVDNAVNGTLNVWASDRPYAKGDNYRPLIDSLGVSAALVLPTGNVGYTATTVVNIIAPYRYIRLVASIAQANATGDSATIARFVVKA